VERLEVSVIDGVGEALEELANSEAIGASDRAACISRGLP
jgi:hypothetical protein